MQKTCQNKSYNLREIHIPIKIISVHTHMFWMVCRDLSYSQFWVWRMSCLSPNDIPNTISRSEYVSRSRYTFWQFSCTVDQRYFPLYYGLEYSSRFWGEKRTIRTEAAMYMMGYIHDLFSVNGRNTEYLSSIASDLPQQQYGLFEQILTTGSTWVFFSLSLKEILSTMYLSFYLACANNRHVRVLVSCCVFQC